MKKVVWLFHVRPNNLSEYAPAINWWYGALEKLGYQVFYEPYETYKFEDFYSLIKETKPDYIIHAVYDKIHTEFEELRKFSKIYVLHSDDDWRFDNFAKHWLGYVDGVITYQNNKKNYRSVGFDSERVHEALWAFNPNTMTTNLNVEKDIFISHIGGLHSNRRKLLNEFNQKGYPVYFPPNKILYEEAKQIWSHSKFSLTFTQSSQGGFKQKKGRIAEIPFFTLMASESFPEMEKYYEPNKEIIIFDTVDEAIDKINFYNNSPTEYNNIYKAGKRRLLTTNTCYHSWNEIMSEIDEDYTKKNIEELLKHHHPSLI